MSLLLEFAPFLLAMLALAAGSAFFSCSEAALFSLQPDMRRSMKRGHAGQRIAVELLEHPERLLSAILFWNLLVNTIYFTLTSIVALQLERHDRHGEAGVLATVAVMGLIFLGELGPKTIGVMAPRGLAAILSVPLAAAVRALDPVMPLLTRLDRALRRVLVPRFTPEPYLDIADLERAIDLSTDDAQLAAREQSALQNIVMLSELQAEELMRPRNQVETFHPPVGVDDLREQFPDSGYALITEADSDEIAAAISLKHLAALPHEHLEQLARPVVYVPWCASVALVLEQLRKQQREVAAVVNELGETLGIITLEDVLETVFEDAASRSARLLATSSIAPAGEGRWLVTGITNLRRISRHFGVELEPTSSVTVAGMLQEVLQSIPSVGDEADWSGFHFCVVEASEEQPLMVELSPLQPEGPFK